MIWWNLISFNLTWSRRYFEYVTPKIANLKSADLQMAKVVFKMSIDVLS